MQRKKIKTSLPSDRFIIDDAVNLKLKDILMQDLFNEREMKGREYDGATKEELEKLDIYVDQFEQNVNVLFNMSINGSPAHSITNEFVMFVVPGNNNDKGVQPFDILGEIVSDSNATIVRFVIPAENKMMFSKHRDQVSSARYVIYAMNTKNELPTQKQIDEPTNILLCKGTIYKSDVLFDITESIIDEKA